MADTEEVSARLESTGDAAIDQPDVTSGDATDAKTDKQKSEFACNFFL